MLFFYLISLSWLIDIIKIKGSTLRSGRMICCQCFFNTERRDGKSFLFGDSKRKKKRRRGSKGRERGGMVEDVKASRERLMRLLGFNQYGIWPEDDWKTNLIWAAIRLSFISLPVSLVDLPCSYCHPYYNDCTSQHMPSFCTNPLKWNKQTSIRGISKACTLCDSGWCRCFQMRSSWYWGSCMVPW